MSPFYTKCPDEIILEACFFMKKLPVEYLKMDDIDNLIGIYDINLNYSKN